MHENPFIKHISIREEYRASQYLQHKLQQQQQPIPGLNSSSDGGASSLDDLGLNLDMPDMPDVDMDVDPDAMSGIVDFIVGLGSFFGG
ncbi:MAG: hypothetical protein F6K54_17545 [Okeania sp. SIO3B5]|uniref:hypothetical protein n=1 Tax=Okeania sp. SIO3B5 TaxID=2607811 RepID=UPI0013FFAC15|nr:hypothetical protein [Okeania sp. SIO3B5]NEO54724.1 hypothetical protein [Okeania sp. SIO3B5]